jgi:hypothetical protein
MATKFMCAMVYGHSFLYFEEGEMYGVSSQRPGRQQIMFGFSFYITLSLLGILLS